MNKTGILGGAFNPVHNGHVHLAKEAISQLKLRKLLVIPTYESPHKATTLLPFEQRAEMCRLAFSEVGEGYSHGKCAVEISDIERKLGGVSYTINTIRELDKLYPDERFYLIIGGDMLYSFTKWYKYESILKESTVCAAARGGDNFADMLEFANEIGRIKVMPTEVVDISSTEVREKLKNGESVSGFIPEGVEKYINENGLYKQP
ncbi:MAG: nicotinate (nicotinamide) nucleotide adenylyltransferase [Oscillospiraceae bacterium]|nr:nicotinate (nicotinamide) nucleotide adenylyltransferase [Oscillospiraceae bacterium]